MEILNNILLSSHTTFKVGGRADYFCLCENETEIYEALAWAAQKELPVFVFGGGSNLLFSDNGVRGLALKINSRGVEFRELKNGIVEARASSGVNWDDFVEKCVARELYGVENLSGIPGSVGATPIQNVGAYGSEVAETITTVETIDKRNLKSSVFTKDECAFGYRDSFFKSAEGENFIITRVTFRLLRAGKLNLSYKDVSEYFLKNTTEPTLINVRRAILAIRSKKFPDLSKQGTAGSFFKNPVITKEKFEVLKRLFPEMPGYILREGRVKLSAGWLIENIAASKGVRVGNVGTHAAQALVVVNYGGARADEIFKFADSLRKKIKDATDIELEMEVRVVGL